MEFSRYELYNLINRPTPLWLVGADLSIANLNMADLSGAHLINAHMGGINFFMVNLRGSELSMTDLSNSDLSMADLMGAKYNKYTQWPDGFDPVKAGAVLTE